ncbi:hypothetical protein QM012_004928 [Aureobasidium pullulans]|uniref:Uncharacterized protein n=1 Tax=Aureobasidium pullulans TaxID=5580 RepID=A0ABR0T763_AURPU
MPPIRTDKSHAKASYKNDKKRPSFSKMSVSISRVKPFAGPKWNCQAFLCCCVDPDPDRERFGLAELDFDTLKDLVRDDLNVCIGEDEEDEDGKNWCLVWYTFDSGQPGRVYDDMSFHCAVEDHRNAHKTIVQLYIIESKDAIKDLEA